MKQGLSILLFFIPFWAVAQTVQADSLFTLSGVMIKGFETNRKLLEAPASISIIDEKAMLRFSGNSLVAVANTVAGVRMEERSPGSYRLSIRGSLLRSTFGIRNIKVYVDEIPFTDAGGNTYLNLIDPAALGTAEILKGPASSLYGAGTGGAVILNVPDFKRTGIDNKTANQFKVRLQGGSYGSFAENFRWLLHKKNYGQQLTQHHLQSNGYRNNSRMRKDVVHFSNAWKLSNKDDLKFHLLLADLYYQTPGGLTFAQWQLDPGQSRPATATLPGAKQQQAAVYNKTVFTGLSNTYRVSQKWTNISAAVFNYTDFKNPFITNFEKRKETSRGLRTKMIYTAFENDNTLKLITGAEWQSTFAHIDNFGNRSGVADTVQTKDEVNAYQRFYFAQADLSVNKKLFINAGASINQFTYRYIRTSDNPATPKKIKDFDAVLSPRLAISYAALKKLYARLIISKGFSAPTMAEVRPSEGSFYESLQPEYGWNYETGIRGSVLKNSLQFDINVYVFNLNNTIVRRTAANGSEYFINAGETKQKGMEAMVAYLLPVKKENFISSFKISSAVTLNNYHFKNYTINNTAYSGNRLTGVPNTIVVNTVDVTFKNIFYLNTTYNYTGKLPLTDANNFYAADYHLLQCKIGYRLILKKKLLEFFAGADNLLNENYSLGNDINAVGNRFYNAAPLRNYFAGVNIDL